ncbi:MAG: hypothetical protein WKH64_16240 [Chloroflexia bacterium]
MSKVILTIVMLGLAVSACMVDRGNPEGANSGAPGMKPDEARPLEPVGSPAPIATRGPIPTIAPTVVPPTGAAQPEGTPGAPPAATGAAGGSETPAAAQPTSASLIYP